MEPGMKTVIEEWNSNYDLAGIKIEAGSKDVMNLEWEIE